MFGIDAIITEDGVVVLEINPRVQSVTSLLSAAELGAGLLPSPLLHLVDFLAGTAFSPAAGTAAQASGRVSALPASGVHRITTPGLPSVFVTSETPPLGALASGEALVWPMAGLDEWVNRGDRLFVVQTPGPVLDCPQGTLTERASTWLAALLRHVRIEGAQAWQSEPPLSVASSRPPPGRDPTATG
jgi:hypothetical protein